MCTFYFFVIRTIWVLFTSVSYQLGFTPSMPVQRRYSSEPARALPRLGCRPGGAGSTVTVSPSLLLHPPQCSVVRWEARGPFCLNALLLLYLSKDKAGVWLPRLCPVTGVPWHKKLRLDFNGSWGVRIGSNLWEACNMERYLKCMIFPCMYTCINGVQGHAPLLRQLVLLLTGVKKEGRYFCRTPAITHAPPTPSAPCVAFGDFVEGRSTFISWLWHHF